MHKKATKQSVKNPKAKKLLYEELNRKLRDENQKLKEENESLKLEVERLQGENWELKKKLRVVINKKPGSNERKKVSLNGIKKRLKDYGNYSRNKFRHSGFEK